MITVRIPANNEIIPSATMKHVIDFRKRFALLDRNNMYLLIQKKKKLLVLGAYFAHTHTYTHTHTIKNLMAPKLYFARPSPTLHVFTYIFKNV